MRLRCVHVRLRLQLHYPSRMLVWFAGARGGRIMNAEEIIECEQCGEDAAVSGDHFCAGCLELLGQPDCGLCGYGRVLPEDDWCASCSDMLARVAKELAALAPGQACPCGWSTG